MDSKILKEEERNEWDTMIPKLKPMMVLQWTWQLTQGHQGGRRRLR